jgi:hypothetical protein
MSFDQVAVIFGLGFVSGGFIVGRLIFWFDRIRYVR